MEEKKCQLSQIYRIENAGEEVSGKLMRMQSTRLEITNKTFQFSTFQPDTF